MRIDSRLATLSAWPLADEGVRQRAFVQAADIASDGRAASERRAALRLCLALARQLPAELREYLIGAARGNRVEPLILRLLDRRSAKVERLRVRERDGNTPAEEWHGPLSVETDAYRNATASGMRAPAVAAPDLGSDGSSASPLVRAGLSQIGDLIERVDRFRGRRSAGEAAEPEAAPAKWLPLEWRTNADGRILQGAARLGGSIARFSALNFEDDRSVQHALSRNLAFSRARCRTPDGERLVLKGRPIFDPISGAFQGYSGTAEQEAQTETLGIPAETVAEVAHEVRTPLNAILGYAEMIETEILGPAPAAYRRDARAIMAEAQRLLMAVDGMGDAAAIDEGQFVDAGAVADPAAVVRSLYEDYGSLARERGASIRLTEGNGATPMGVDAGAVVRGLARLLSALLALSQPDEELEIGWQASSVFLTRPAALADISDQALLADRSGASGAPLLGLAFALRILRRLAEANGGELVMESSTFRIRIPPRRRASDRKAS